MAVVIDRWRRRDRATGKLVPTARDGKGLRYLSHFRDTSGCEVTKAFALKRDAQRWLDEQTAEMVRGTYVHPTAVKTTVGEWCETWLSGYASRRPRTVRQARVHIAQITTAFGNRPLAAVRPSDVKTWTARLRADGLADSYVYALHNRLSQLMSDAVHDGILARNPCSRRTTPGAGKPRPYVATTEQVWALYDAVAEHLRPAILLGAFVGLRTAEVVGLRGADVDFMRGIVRPVQQRESEPLKSETSRTPMPIPSELALELSAAVARWGATSWSRTARGAVLDVGAAEGGRVAGGVPFPRSPALPGVAAHRQGPRREGRPAPTPARLGAADCAWPEGAAGRLRSESRRSGPARLCRLPWAGQGRCASFGWAF